MYLSLGSNVGDRAANLHTAMKRLRELGDVAVVSALYEAEPVELEQQPWFLNCAVALDTALSPAALLQSLLTIEREMGRVRWKEKGPRTIDMDILLFSDYVLDEPGLKVPHPAMARRRFVLEPLAEIAGAAIHPVLNKAVSELLLGLPSGQVVRRVQEKR